MERPQHTAILQFLLVMAATLAFSRAVVSQQGETTSPPFRFGQYSKTIANLESPTGVAIDRAGNIYIVQSTAHRVTVIDRDGNILNQWGRYGGGPGELAFPAAIDVLGEGDDAFVFVIDTGNHRVNIYRTTGRFVRSWGAGGNRPGVEPGQFNRPRGITVDNDLLFVADEGNNRVQILNHDGTMLGSIGTAAPGVEPGRFSRPRDVAVDRERNIYVADSDNNRIQKFTLDGVFVAAWGDYGLFPGLMDQPSALTVREDRVYVVDENNSRVQVFALDGQPIYQWGIHAILPREGNGELHYPADLAIAHDCTFAVICETFEDRCQLFNVATPVVAEADSGSPWKPRPATTHFGRRLSLDGNLLAIAEPETHTIYIFRIEDEVPVLVTQLQGRGRKPHEFTRIAGLDLAIEATEPQTDADGVNLLVADTALSRIQHFALNYDPTEDLRFVPLVARLQRSFDLNYFSGEIGERGLPWTIEPAAIERDRNGRLWIADPRNAMVHVFDGDMRHIRSFNGGDGEVDALREPTDLAFSRDGMTIYVVDRIARQVRMFDADGNSLRAIEPPLDSGSPFIDPFGVFAGVDGFVYVSDAGAHAIVKFDEAGEYITRWGRKGFDDGEFWKPGEMAQAPDGRLFIADYGNHQAQIFSPDGEWLVTFGLGKPMTRELKAQQQPAGTEQAQ